MKEILTYNQEIDQTIEMGPETKEMVKLAYEKRQKIRLIFNGKHAHKKEK